MSLEIGWIANSDGSKRKSFSSATPEENSYIEAFHSIVHREVIDRYEFLGFYDAKSTLVAHRDWYNNRRRHATIKMTPAKKWKEYFGRDLSFDPFVINHTSVYQQVIENFEIKPYFCLPENSFEEENYKTILSFKSN